jgi:hypothetical protein
MKKQSRFTTFSENLYGNFERLVAVGSVFIFFLVVLGWDWDWDWDWWAALPFALLCGPVISAFVIFIVESICYPIGMKRDGIDWSFWYGYFPPNKKSSPHPGHSRGGSSASKPPVSYPASS